MNPALNQWLGLVSQQWRTKIEINSKLPRVKTCMRCTTLSLNNCDYCYNVRITVEDGWNVSTCNSSSKSNSSPQTKKIGICPPKHESRLENRDAIILMQGTVYQVWNKTNLPEKMNSSFDYKHCHPRIFEDIRDNSEIIIQKIEKELDSYQEEQELLKHHVSQLIENKSITALNNESWENQREPEYVHLHYNEILNIGCEHGQLINDAVSKIKQQEKQFKEEEQVLLKKQVSQIIESDSSYLNSDIDIIKPSNNESWETQREHVQLTNDAISNLKQQVDHLKEERCTIQQLWKTSQDAIANLETEIQSYRTQLFNPTELTKIKQQYSSTIKNFENVITSQKSKLTMQTQKIRTLEEDKTKANSRINELLAVIEEQDNKLLEQQQMVQKNSCLKQKLQEALLKNSELEMSTNLAKCMIDECFLREKNALEKLQETLLIADAAVAEKEEALKREQIIREDCEKLAETIGQVMEEAARKVDKNVESLRDHHEEKEKALMKKNAEMRMELENEKRLSRIVEARCLEMEQKLGDVLKENHCLENELQQASQALTEMQFKLEATENLLKEDKKSEKFLEEREQQLREYIENNRQIKERWKNTIEDVTNKFGIEIQRLQKENSRLKAEIHAQRLKEH